MTDYGKLVKWIIRSDRHSLAALVKLCTEAYIFAQPWIVRQSIQKLHLLNRAPIADEPSADMTYATHPALSAIAHRRRKQLEACMGVQIGTCERTEGTLLIIR